MWTCRGVIAEARGDLAAAAASLGEAVQRWSDYGFPLEAARAQLDLGRVLTSLGRQPEAAASS